MSDSQAFKGALLTKNGFNLGALAFLTLAIYFLIQQTLFPAAYDASAYWEIATRYNEVGMLGSRQELRTYAYPWVLSLVLKLGSGLNLPAPLLLFLLQSGLYFWAVLFLVKSVRGWGMRLTHLVYGLLCVNVFSIPYLSVSLTDSVYSTLTLLWIGWIFRGYQWQTQYGVTPRNWYFWGMLLVNMAVVVRPAAVWMYVPLAGAMASAWFRDSARISLIRLSLLSLLACIPLLPQIYLNATHFQQISFLPVADLGAFQLQVGIQNLKYGTWMGAGSPRMCYTSAALIGQFDGPYELSWYGQDFWRTAKLLAFKLVGSFDFDFLVPYPYERLAIRWLPASISLSILYLGLVTVGVHWKTQVFRCLGPRWLPALVFISWSSVTLLSAVELRFTLPMMIYFLCLSAVLIDRLMFERSIRFWFWLSSGWLAVLPILALMAHFVRAQRSLGCPVWL